MTNQQKTIILSTTIIIFLLMITNIMPLVIAPAIIIQPHKTSTINSPHLLILLSPQYHQDQRIIQTITKYQQTIQKQPEWCSQLILLDNTSDQPNHIEKIIQQTANKTNLTACLIIGEDIHLPTKTTYQTIEKPTLGNWATIQTKDNLTKKICISLLQPSPNDPYKQKQKEIEVTLTRFINKRSLTFKQNTTIIEQSTLSTYAQTDYLHLAKSTNATYYENTNAKTIIDLLHTQHDLICLHGHGQPHKIQLNSTSNLTISTDTVSLLQTKILTIDGCYTDSQYNSKTTNPTPFISTICKSNTIHLAFFGLLSQQTNNQKTNIINTLLPSLSGTFTVAEAINNANIPFDFIFTGDPTINVTM